MSPSSSAHRSRHKFLVVKRNNPLPPALSLVLADSERASSLTSAAGHLPSILRRAMPPNQSKHPIITENPSAPGASPELPPTNTFPESIPPTLDDIPPTPQPVTLPHTDPPWPPVSESLSNASAPARDPQADSTPSLPNKRSWFNMFSLSHTEKTSAVETKAGIGPPPDAIRSIHPCTENDSKLDPLATANMSGPVAIHATSTHPADQPLPEDGATHSDSSSLPCNGALPVCERQTASQPTSIPPPHHPSIARDQESVVRPAPHSATSIFPFNFTALVKSRSPPQMEAIPPPPNPCVEPSLGCQDVAPDTGNTQNVSMDEIEPSCTVTKPTPDVADRCDQSLTQQTTEVRTNAWWYFGWSGGPSATAPVSIAPRMQSADAQSSELSDPQSSNPIENLSTKDDAPCVDDTSEVVVTADSLPNYKNVSQDHDADATHLAQVSTWYSPWSWYHPSPSTSTPIAPSIKTAAQDGPAAHMDTKPEDLGNHPASEQASPQESTVIESVGYINPVRVVISANPTGWLSFFTAKAVAMKSIADDNEGKMEVMEIDDEILPVSNSAPPSAFSATQPSPIPVTRPSALAPQSHTSDTMRPSSPHSKKTNDKRTPIPLASGHPESAVNDALMRQPSPSPSKKSSVKAPVAPPLPNLVLPTWNDTFHSLPRSEVHREPPSVLSKTLRYVSDVLFCRDEASSNKGKGKGKEPIYSSYDRALPRAWDVINGGPVVDVLKGCKKVVIIGVHGWFPGAVLRTLAGEPTGTSSRFVNGVVDALELFQVEHNVKLDKVTKIPLEGEGTINRRVERLYQNLINNKEWLDDIHNADAIFIAAHSQGSVVSTHLLDRLITDRHIRTSLNADASISASGIASGSVLSVQPPQRICCLALCGVHLGPLRYLSTSSLVQPYIQYFENTAARELFELQNTESAISRDYVRALRNVLTNGIKMVYIASLTDQVVGLYSGLFTSVSHPLILRALYIDGDAYHPSDFLSNLLVLLLRIRNAGLSDGGLLTHLSEVTAGSLNGIGHSTPYEERSTYSLAVNYLFLTDSGSGAQVEFVEEPFNALTERNDYEIPWALRDLIADEKVASLFSKEIVALRDTFRDWHPKTTILRDVKRKLQPIQRLSSALIASHTSKL